MSAFEDWDQLDNFTAEEFACPHCGKVEMQSGFIIACQNLRHYWGVPLKVTSGFRCQEHNLAVGGASKSAHLLGLGADFERPHGIASAKLNKDLSNLFNGVGIRMHGDNQYFHVDLKPRVAFWTYN